LIANLLLHKYGTDLLSCFSGIATKDGLCFQHEKSNVSCYGRRLGSPEEAAQLGYVRVSTVVKSSHLLLENPFRYVETVAAPATPEILSWDVCLARLAANEKMRDALGCLKCCEQQEKRLVLQFYPHMKRQSATALVGYLNQQHPWIKDESIGQVLACKMGCKPSCDVIFDFDSEVSAEQLGYKFEEFITEADGTNAAPAALSSSASTAPVSSSPSVSNADVPANAADLAAAVPAAVPAAVLVPPPSGAVHVSPVAVGSSSSPKSSKVGAEPVTTTTTATSPSVLNNINDQYVVVKTGRGACCLVM
jgi:hypothetical protein